MPGLAKYDSLDETELVADFFNEHIEAISYNDMSDVPTIDDLPGADDTIN